MSLALQDLTVRRDGCPTVDHVTLSVPAGSFVGLIGPNGAGKTTLMQAALGLIPATGRSDLAARRLLSRMAEWDALPHELHELLCGLPGEHGQLFAWLDSQLHEHGVQSWAALREGMRGQPFEALAERVMTGPDGAPIEDAEGEEAADAARELRNVLDFMLDDLLKALQSEAIAAVGSDPAALERYKALEARRLELRHRLKPSVAG